MAMTDPISAADWGPARARHLLNRAGFGLTAARVAELAALTPEAAVARLVDYDAIATTLPEPDFLLEPDSRRDRMRDMVDRGMDKDQIHLKIQEQQREEREAIEKLKGWWLQRMYTTPRPLEEKMTLFWHGHFAVSSQKVKSSYVTYDLNRTLRKHAVGNFKALTTAVGQSPAMLEYLDNRKSTKDEPNENWARELMELFTLGKGNYTEDDIKNSARAFTGWMCNFKEFIYAPRRHDFGQKTFMGQTGDFDGWKILDIIFEQPAVAKIITAKLWKFYAHESPEPEVIDALAKTFRDSNYELKPVLKQMFLSQAFYSPKTMGSQIKSPAQFLLQLCDDMGMQELPLRALVQGCRMLDQDLFYPPNVKGWDGNRAWINANTLLMRYNAPPFLVGAAMKREQMEDKMMGQVPDGTMQMEAAPAATPDQKMGAWRKEAMAQAREKLKTLPPAERKAKMEAFRAAGPGEKMMMLKSIGIEPPADILKDDPLHIFDTLAFKTCGECVAALEKRLLVAPMDDAQRKALLAAFKISDPATPLDRAQLDLDTRRSILRLVTSIPQYQLC